MNVGFSVLLYRNEFGSSNLSSVKSDAELNT